MNKFDASTATTVNKVDASTAAAVNKFDTSSVSSSDISSDVDSLGGLNAMDVGGGGVGKGEGDGLEDEDGEESEYFESQIDREIARMRAQLGLGGEVCLVMELCGDLERRLSTLSCRSTARSRACMRSWAWAARYAL